MRECRDGVNGKGLGERVEEGGGGWRRVMSGVRTGERTGVRGG